MEEMTSAWTNFARSGDPNGHDVPSWPRYDEQKRSTMEFRASQSKAVNDPYSAERQAWSGVSSNQILDHLWLFARLLGSENAH